MPEIRCVSIEILQTVRFIELVELWQTYAIICRTKIPKVSITSRDIRNKPKFLKFLKLSMRYMKINDTLSLAKITKIMFLLIMSYFKHCR